MKGWLIFIIIFLTVAVVAGIVTGIILSKKGNFSCNSATGKCEKNKNGNYKSLKDCEKSCNKISPCKCDSVMCPSECGYNDGKITPGHTGSCSHGYTCNSITCPSTSPCPCKCDSVTCPSECGYHRGQITPGHTGSCSHGYTCNPITCPSTSPCPVPCKCDSVTCPSECGYHRGQITPGHTGSCSHGYTCNPITCPSTAPCFVYSPLKSPILAAALLQDKALTTCAMCAPGGPGKVPTGCGFLEGICGWKAGCDSVPPDPCVNGELTCGAHNTWDCPPKSALVDGWFGNCFATVINPHQTFSSQAEAKVACDANDQCDAIYNPDGTGDTWTLRGITTPVTYNKVNENGIPVNLVTAINNSPVKTYCDDKLGNPDLCAAFYKELKSIGSETPKSFKTKPEAQAFIEDPIKGEFCVSSIGTDTAGNFYPQAPSCDYMQGGQVLMKRSCKTEPLQAGCQPQS